MLTGVDGVEWSGVDTPQSVMTTRAPAVLKSDGQLLLQVTVEIENHLIQSGGYDDEGAEEKRDLT